MLPSSAPRLPLERLDELAPLKEARVGAPPGTAGVVSLDELAPLKEARVGVNAQKTALPSRLDELAPLKEARALGLGRQPRCLTSLDELAPLKEARGATTPSGSPVSSPR